MISKKIQSALAALLCGAALWSATGTAQAQSTTGSDTEQTNPQAIKPLAFKLGAFIPTSSGVRDRVGDAMFLVEAEYTIQDLFATGGVTTINLGYTERNNLQIIPFTLSEMYRKRLRDSNGLTFATGGLDYYFGLGGGLYFTRFNQSGGGVTSKTLFGGLAVAGLNISDSVFFELKYHLISRYNDFDVSGLQATAGLRF